MTDELRRLRSAAEEAVEFFYSGPQFEVSEEDRVPFQTIFPLAAHTMKEVRAALILMDAGRSYVAGETCAALCNMP
jgi:hypothetical protein